MVGARLLGERAGFGALLKRALLEDAPFLGAVILYVAAALLLSATTGLPADYQLRFTPDRWKLSGAATFLFGFTLFLCLLVHEVTGRKNSIYDPGTWRNVVRRTFPGYKTLNYAVIFLVLPTFSGVFTAFKIAIADFVAFGPWDVRFMEWDRWLHFGRLPHELFAPVLGHAPVTKLLDLAYYVWFPVVWMTLVWQAWHGSRDTETRSQFLLSFALCWMLLGSFAAIVFSSAGPVYFGRVTGVADPYVGLMDYLAAVDAQFSLKSFWAHDVLWQSYVDADPTQFSGISAMPSLHVSMVVLLAILGFRVDRRVGWAYAIYAALIFLGSFELAWHYAIDGYVAAAGTAAIWWLSGKGIRRWRTRIGLPVRPA